MTRPSIENIRQISNYTDAYRWNVIIASWPLFGTLGGLLPWPNSQALNLRCESVMIPKVDNEKIEVNIRGHKVYQSGQATYNNEITLNMVDTVDQVLMNFLKTWRELVWQTRTGVSQPKLTQEATIILHQLNSLDQPIWQYTLYGAWLKDFDNGSLTNESAVRKPTLTLNYDYYDDGQILI